MNFLQVHIHLEYCALLGVHTPVWRPCPPHTFDECGRERCASWNGSFQAGILGVRHPVIPSVVLLSQHKSPWVHGPCLWSAPALCLPDTKVPLVTHTLQHQLPLLAAPVPHPRPWCLKVHPLELRAQANPPSPTFSFLSTPIKVCSSCFPLQELSSQLTIDIF